MTAYEIPLTATPQRMNIALGGKSYVLQVVWNNVTACWVMDLMNASGEMLIGGLALVTGVDLLGQFEYLSFGGQLQVQSDSDLNAVPDLHSLGVTGHVYFVVD